MKRLHRFDDEMPWIEVEEVETAFSKQAKAKRSAQHIGCPVPWLKKVYEVSRSRTDIVVALYLYRWHILRKRRTVSASNVELAEFGINRLEKYRSLERLEKGELIKVGRRGKHALKVTLVKIR
jgi:hypothetical protein